MDVPEQSVSVAVISVLFLACVLYAGMTLWSGVGEVVTELETFPPFYAVLILTAVSFGYFIRYLRWDYYLRRLGHEIPFRSNLRIFLASFLMAISPGKVGEVMKSYFLKKEFSLASTPTAAGFFCERFTDVGAMIVLSGLGFYSYPRGGLAITLILAVMLCLLILLQKPNWLETVIFSPLSRWTWLERSIERCRVFYRTSRNLLSVLPLSIGLGMGVVSWGLEGLCLYWILLGLGTTEILPFTAIFIFSASVLLGAASMIPGGIGSSEALMIAMLIFFGANDSTAVTATLLIRLATLWYGVGLGAIAWFLSTRK